MSFMLYTIRDKDLIPLDDIDINEKQIYIIIDIHGKRSKIWIWSGSEANKLDRYLAGVSATKLKSRRKLYGASIEVVESGKEPEEFPELSESELIKSTDEEFHTIEKIQPESEPESIPKPQLEPELEEEADSVSEKKEKEQTNEQIRVVELEKELSDIKEKVNLFFKEIGKDLNEIQKKMEDFLKNME